MAASATFALKVGVWFRRGRLFMVSSDSLGTACPLSGRNSTYRSVQISETSSFQYESSNCIEKAGLCSEPYIGEMVEVKGEWRCPNAHVEGISAACRRMPGTRQASRRILRESRAD